MHRVMLKIFEISNRHCCEKLNQKQATHEIVKNEQSLYAQMVCIFTFIDVTILFLHHLCDYLHFTIFCKLSSDVHCLMY